MKTFVIAEIGSNWEGSIIKAKKLINQSKIAGANAVKFQMWRPNDLYSSDHPNWTTIKKSELTFSKAKKIKKFADSIGIEFFCSAFYPEAVDFLETQHIKRYKVASRTCLLKDPFSLQTLEKKAKTRKHIIISMGMGGDKKLLKKIFSKNKVTFCYCISKYPASLEEIKWPKLVKYDGFSDHTKGIVAPILFSILKKIQGAKYIVIEKHIKLKNSKGPDAPFSIDTGQLKELISYIRLIESTRF